MTAPRSSPEAPPLLEQLSAWLGSAPPQPRLTPQLLAALQTAPPELQHQVVQLLLQHHVRTRRATDGLREINGMLEQKLAQLAEPPHCLARLLAFDGATRRALVGTAPAARIEVPIHDDVDPALLHCGVDVLLTAERNCVLRVLPPGTAPGTARVAAFRGFVDTVPQQGLRAALAGDAGGDHMIWVGPQLAERLAAMVAAERRAIRVGIDEFGLAVALCDEGNDDARTAAGRFRLPLEPIGPERIVGLHAQRAQIDDAVARVVGRGTFALAQGTTGCGKSHLGGYALHRLQQLGETAVLGLRSSKEHRFHGQEESDVEELFACARGLVEDGCLVLLFVDEIDRHFYRSRYGESVHVNAARATWLAQIGGDLRGILLYGTTNKTAQLPDELHNRVTHPLSFGRLERAQSRALLDLYLPADTPLCDARNLVLDSVAAWLHDGQEGSGIATVQLRDQSQVTLFPRDLRQLSARFLQELALRLYDDTRRHGALTVARARSVATARVHCVFDSLGLTALNVGDRTFVEFAPRNPPERVVCDPPVADVATALFRYQPLEVADVACS